MKKTSLRILHIVPVNKKREIPIFLQHQINSLLSNNINCDIYAFRGSEISPFTPIKSFGQILGLIWQVSTTKNDLIHAQWGSLLGFITVIANLKRKPIILTLRGSDVNRVNTESYFNYLIKSFMTNFSVRHANFVICVSENLFKLIDKDKNKSAIIPDGIPTEIFLPIEITQARQRLNWKDDHKYILFYCGGRPIEKNLALAHKVNQTISQMLNSIEFVVIENNLSQEKLSLMYSAANVLLFTSTNEGSPNVIREAIACGCPVISVDVGDAKKWINMSKSGVICSNDSTVLASAILDLFKSGARADSKIAGNFSTSNTLKRLLKVYRSEYRKLGY
jgi:teichuronic acid biosynthesis glycosyltransferase TuaC